MRCGISGAETWKRLDLCTLYSSFEPVSKFSLPDVHVTIYFRWMLVGIGPVCVPQAVMPPSTHSGRLTWPRFIAN